MVWPDSITAPGAGAFWCYHAADAAVYAEDLKFMPKGSLMPDETGCRFAVGQQQMLPQGVQALDDKILVAKLRPGQVIDLEAHCIKGACP